MTSAASSRRWVRGAAILFLLGATLGSGLDAIHTHCGATSYPEPIAFRMAVWTPLLFGGAFTIGLLRPLLDRSGGRPRPPLRSAGLSMGLFAVAYFASVLPAPWWTVAAILGAIFVASYFLFDRSRVGLAIALGAAVGGPLVEFLLTQRGAFAHLKPTYLGLPGWLPFLYLCAAVGLTTLARWLVEPADAC